MSKDEASHQNTATAAEQSFSEQRQPRRGKTRQNKPEGSYAMGVQLHSTTTGVPAVPAVPAADVRIIRALSYVRPLT